MEPTTAASGMSGNGIIFAMIVFLVVMMVLTSRGQKKRDAERNKQISALQKGDKVVLLGGIIGTIVGFNQEILEVKVSESTKISVLPSGIVSVLNGNNSQQGDKK